MRQAGADYLREEARCRGARPRVKAVLFPYELDYGLAPGSGEFIQTAYGGEPGKLVMGDGYLTSGSWTSPVVQSFSPYLDEAVPSWEEPAGHMDVEIRLRTGETPAGVAQAAFTLLTSGQDMSLAPYFQVKVDFDETIRAWGLDDPGEADEFTAYAVDQGPDGGFESYASDGPGCLTAFSLAGRLTLPEREIIDPGGVRVELARDFSELRTGDHVLVLDNRVGQWLNRAENAYHERAGLDPEATGAVSRLGVGRRHGGLAVALPGSGAAPGGDGPRLASAASRPPGKPGWGGGGAQAEDRRPGRHGRAAAVYAGHLPGPGELIRVVEATVSEITRTGSGSATVQLLGTYRGDYLQDYLLEAETSGEVGSATFRWSLDQGQSWQKTGLGHCRGG